MENILVSIFADLLLVVGISNTATFQSYELYLIPHILIFRSLFSLCFDFIEINGTSNEEIHNSTKNEKRRRFFQKSKSLNDSAKPRQNSLSNLENTKINPRTHSTKGISKVRIKLYIIQTLQQARVIKNSKICMI